MKTKVLSIVYIVGFSFSKILFIFTTIYQPHTILFNNTHYIVHMNIFEKKQKLLPRNMYYVCQSFQVVSSIISPNTYNTIGVQTCLISHKLFLSKIQCTQVNNCTRSMFFFFLSQLFILKILMKSSKVRQYFSYYMQKHAISLWSRKIFF